MSENWKPNEPSWKPDHGENCPCEDCFAKVKDASELEEKKAAEQERAAREAERRRQAKKKGDDGTPTADDLASMFKL